MDSPYTLCGRLMAEAQARRCWMPYTFSSGHAWFATPNGFRLEISESDGCFTISPVPIRKKRFGPSWKVTPKGCFAYGNSRTGYSDQPTGLPNDVQQALNSAKPIPRLNSVYGYRAGGKIVAIVLTWQNSSVDDTPMTPVLVLDGERVPTLYTKVCGRLHLDLAQWWEKVDKGQIVDVSSLVSKSQRGVYHNDRLGSLIIEDDWTGVNGPALYLDEDARGKVKLSRAQELRGRDIRRTVR